MNSAFRVFLLYFTFADKRQNGENWFDVDRFHAECKRILVPDGFAVILANERTYDAFTRKQHELCLKHCPGFTSLSHGIEKVCLHADRFFNGEYKLERYDFPIYYSKESFISRSLSSSYAPEAGSNGHEAYVRELKLLSDEYFDGEEMIVASSTVILWGRIR